MRGGNQRILVLVLGLLAGSFLLVPEPARDPAPAAAAAPPDREYRLGYTSVERLALMATLPGGDTRSVLPDSQRGHADLDADVRDGVLVWVSRRAASGQSDLDGSLYLLRPDGAPVRLVGGWGTISHPALSPDGRRVAFTSDRAGSEDIWLVETNGSSPRRLTDHPGRDSWPTWSPDGRRLAFSSTRDDPAGDIYLLNVAGGQPSRVTTDPAADTQPAWSPDGRRLAFTTTRFSTDAAPRTDVVSMPVGGGAVTRMVPAPWDSAESAWSPDGRRLAFTTTFRDNAGDVYLVEAGRVRPVTSTSLGEHHPTWQDEVVVYTTAVADSSTDVWSADASGRDRRNHTARPGASESGPAFSPDGTRLAYSATEGGGERIVVADASGTNPQRLIPPGTAASDRDTDPSWSPDGSAIAFTRTSGGEVTVSRVLVVAVADSRLMAEVPMPVYLSGSDADPAWSPDGRQLAISRTASARDSDLTYPIIDRPARAGSDFSAEQTVQTPPVPPRPDIVFLVDNTNSMAKPGEGGDTVIGQLKQRIPAVMEGIREEQPEARFGLATFSGSVPGVIIGADGSEIIKGDTATAESSSGDGTSAAAGRTYDPKMYDPRQDLTSDEAAMLQAVQTLKADSPYYDENWFYALRQIARQDRMTFRQDSSRIVVLISDTYSVDKTLPPPESGAIGKEDLIRELNQANIALVGVPIVGADFEDGLNWDGVAKEIADRTHGLLTENSDPGQMIGAIDMAIRELWISVDPMVEHCDEGLSVAFTPDPAEVKASEPAVFTERVSVAPNATPGSVLHCTLRFALQPPQPGADNLQELIVRVVYPDRPLVRVDDVLVPAASPDGTRVSYEASAVDSLGRPLPTRCAPASGALFPVGQTVVTCTAVDAAGRTGQDTAAISVVQPRADGTRIWFIGLSGTADTLTVTDQHDFSITVGDPCRTGSRDRDPAWSPSGTALAFTDSGDPVRLCVANTDGSEARYPLDTSQVQGNVSDPAWAPDGSRIAVAVRHEQASSILLVPATGGPAATVIRDVGKEPAFQSLPTPDLSLSVSVGGQPGYLGGDTIPVTFTVRNTSRLPAANVWLDLGLPPALLPAASMDSRCDAGSQLCLLGALGLGDQHVIKVALPPRAAVSTVVSAQLAATVGGVPASRAARAPIRVLAPGLSVGPAIGPSGFVPLATGVNFPPGARVRLAWAPGVTTTPDTVTVAADGTLRAQVLVLRKDVLGPRYLLATRVSGTRFGPVRTVEPFLVVPRPLDPPQFEDRR